MRLAAAALTSLALPSLAYAHHSFTEFDQARTIQISGTLKDVAWQNPHVRLRVESIENGTAVTWDVETSSIGILTRAHFDPKSLRVGDKVSVAGSPSKAAPNRMFGMNVLLPSGQELVMLPGARLQWQTSTTRVAPPPAQGGGEPPTKGIFKVWGSSFDDPEAQPGALWAGISSLTPAATKALAAWDPVHDTITPGCEPKGMPTIMEQPYGLAFEDHGATIALRLEEYDTVRTIHLSDGAAAPATKSLLGHSVGKWDGPTLVVATTGISWPYIAANGLPQGPSSRLEERFTPSPDGKRLAYTLTITDPDK
jgi:hypothetical protein